MNKLVFPLTGTDAATPKANGFVQIDSLQYGPYRYWFDGNMDLHYDILYEGKWYTEEIETREERDADYRAAIEAGAFKLSPIQE